MWQWNRWRLSIRIVPRVKGEKEIESRFERGTRLMPSSERYLLSCVFIIFSTVPLWFKSCMILDCMVSVQVVLIELTFADEKGQRNEARRLPIQILQPYSLYQMVWQQARDGTRKPFGRNNIYIDLAKKIEGSSSKIPVKWH